MLQLAMLFLALVPARAEDLKNETEAGLVHTSGNTRLQTLSASHVTSYGWEKVDLWNKNDLKFESKFLRSKSLGVLSAKKWNLSLRYERNISGVLSAFLSQGLESDRFAGYLQRYNTDVGPKLRLLHVPQKWLWLAEAGYRFTKEHSTNGSRSTAQKGRLYSELNYRMSDTSSAKLWAEYIPNFSNGRDWLFNSEVSASVLLTSVLALKTAYLVNFDNQPNPGIAKKTDSTFTTSLVAKY
jgi:putative salt-induced outer membrane protein YdiY